MQSYDAIDNAILMALAEDLSHQDMTSAYLFDDTHLSTAHLICKENGVISGIDVFERTMKFVDSQIQIEWFCTNGSEVHKGDVLAHVSGKTKALLAAERTALNFLQRMSGIASETHKYVASVMAYPVKIVDTRKTVPGLRIFDKKAVRDGGGHNHRFSLSDGVLIKDNHINAVGSIQKAIEKARANVPHTFKIEIEVESIEGLEEALRAGADIIMLDNMTDDMMREAVRINDHKALLEASGNMSLQIGRAHV